MQIEEVKYCFNQHFQAALPSDATFPLDGDEDARLDAALGLDPESAEPRQSYGEILTRRGLHRIEKGDLPYAVIRRLFRFLPEEAAGSEPLVDLGCGYGRIGFYGALVREGFRFWGIEVLDERAAEARRVRDALGLDGLTFETGDALTAPWPDTSWFSVMNPVLPSQSGVLLERLGAVARRRRVLVASVSTFAAALAEQPWARPVGPPPRFLQGLRWFESAPGGRRVG